MDQIKISAKNLGQVALKDFCERCYWIKLKTANKLPFQIFPGIFSSIDAYTKKITHAILETENRPEWMKTMGDIVGWNKAPHWSKFNTVIAEYNILLNGAADDILVRREGGIVIPDYKTAKFTKNQDKLLPMYAIQLNGYSMIHEATGLGLVEDLYLIYFEPLTDEEMASTSHDPTGFKLEFEGHTIEMPINPGPVNEALEITRNIYEMGVPPTQREGCKDCANLDAIIELIGG